MNAKFISIFLQHYVWPVILNGLFLKYFFIFHIYMHRSITYPIPNYVSRGIAYFLNSLSGFRPRRGGRGCIDWGLPLRDIITNTPLIDFFKLSHFRLSVTYSIVTDMLTCNTFADMIVSHFWGEPKIIYDSLTICLWHFETFY